MCGVEIEHISIEENMSQKQNVGTVNRYRIVPVGSRKNLLKSSKELQTMSQITREKLDKNDKNGNPYEPHPAAKFLFGTVPALADYKKFVALLYQGLFYSVCSLKGPSQEYIRRKSVRLPEPKNSARKFLMLDLDETLIHSVWGEQQADATLEQGGEVMKFKIRPFCFQFLQKAARWFEVYVFTASTEDYAKPIVDYLNQRGKTIQGLLSRNHCLETHNGLRIKDLRIIKNRPLSEIVIIDNLVHSFGLQLENGIPILEFTGNLQDRQLLGIERLLEELSTVSDVRECLSRRLSVKKCLEIGEEEFLNVRGPMKKGGSRLRI